MLGPKYRNPIHGYPLRSLRICTKDGSLFSELGDSKKSETGSCFTKIYVCIPSCHLLAIYMNDHHTTGAQVSSYPKLDKP